MICTLGLCCNLSVYKDQQFPLAIAQCDECIFRCSGTSDSPGRIKFNCLITLFSISNHQLKTGHCDIRGFAVWSNPDTCWPYDSVLVLNHHL